MYECPKCGTVMVYDTNRCLICPKCDVSYWDRETGRRTLKGDKHE